MFDDAAHVAAYRVPLVFPQGLDLLGDILAVEAVVGDWHFAQYCCLVLGPGIEIVVVVGALLGRAIGHGRLPSGAYSAGASSKRRANRSCQSSVEVKPTSSLA